MQRRPKRYLITEEGARKIPKDAPVSTNETIHFTVRVLLGTHLRTCPSLAKYRTSIDNNVVTWRLTRKNGNETRTCLREETFTPQEEGLLMQWLNADQAENDNTSLRDVLDQVTETGKAKDTFVNIALGDILRQSLAEAREPKILFPPDLNKPATPVTQL